MGHTKPYSGGLQAKKTVTILAAVLLLIGTVAINYVVKVLMKNNPLGPVTKLGNIRIGNLAPNFTLNDLFHHSVTLKANHESLILLCFWASWCEPCRRELRTLQEFAATSSPRHFEILAIDEGERAKHVRRWIEERRYSLHVLLDPDEGVRKEYGIGAIPALVLVDKAGLVQWIEAGYSYGDTNLSSMLSQMN